MSHEQIIGRKPKSADLSTAGLFNTGKQFWNLNAAELTEHTLKLNQGVLSDKGALCVNTGEFTGRSPQDKFIVKDETTANNVNWGKINIPVDSESFDRLHQKLCAYLQHKNVYVKDVYACADERYRMPLRAITETPWSAMFAGNMFLRPEMDEIDNMEPEWTVICAPGFKADPALDGTRKHNFAMLDFTRKMILIGGTAYTGEIKKGIFTVLNYTLPHEKNVLSMHCSANKGFNGDVAVFFGLSGTGKTTLSADANRKLIGDDEHGWSDEGVFNFEGGCYAKCINLSAEKEPEIYEAIRHGSILENIAFHEGTRTPDYDNDSITENTRVSYPIYHIPNALEKSVGGQPTNIFFLTCDAFGVLPPISKLTPEQAMYHFISGYTAKVAGTEVGIIEPQLTFSTCFGSPFLPLHPTRYAEMLGDKLKKHNVQVWLINTGWTGGPYGTGNRMKLSYTRAMINAALMGALEDVEYAQDPIFNLSVPQQCPNVPDELLNPRDTWADPIAYDKKAASLAESFAKNFKQFEDKSSEAIRQAGPAIQVL